MTEKATTESEAIENELDAMFEREAKAAVNKMDFPPGDPLKPPEAERARYLRVLRETVKDDFVSKFFAWTILISDLGDKDQALAGEIEEIVNKYQEAEKPYDEEKAQALDDYLRENNTVLCKEMGLTGKHLNAINEMGLEYLEQNIYPLALETFGMLTVFCPVVYRYWLNHGICLLRMENYEEALESFKLCEVLADQDGPYHLFYQMTCLLQLEDLDRAKDLAEQMVNADIGEDDVLRQMQDGCKELLTAN